MKQDINEDKLDTARFTIVIPMELSIRLDMAREKSKLTKSTWITDAISEKLDSTEKETTKLEEIKNELDEIKRLLLSK
jgi:hypothetical protein